jgi:hypothetical protein
LVDAGYKVKDVEDFENSVNDEIMFHIAEIM